MELDRDVNAAINIRDFAIQKSLAKKICTGGTPGINACGVGSSGRRGGSRAGETADGEAGNFPRS